MKTILLISAMPRGWPALNLPREANEITASLRQGKNGRNYTVKQVTAATLKDVGKALLEHSPSIIHFMGHGQGKAGLVLEDDIGQEQLVPNEAIATLFGLFNTSLECVLFNACYSREQAEAVKTQVPVVIGMVNSIEDSAARAFSASFYQALADGRPYDFAFKFALPSYMTGAPGRDLPIMLGTPQPAPVRQAIRLFYAYAEKDKRYRADVEKFLVQMKREKVIEQWHDGVALAGAAEGEELAAALNEAHVILLLVSADFLASDLCWSTQVERAMERHEAREARVIPILLRPCDWSGTPFAGLKPLPGDRRPVSAWPNRDSAFLNIAQGIRQVVETLRG